MSTPSSTTILYTVSSMRSFRSTLPDSVALVPTMGILHAGHMSLIRLAAEQTDAIIVSIYANPTQLAAAEEQASYPSTLEADVTALARLDDELRQKKGLGRIRAVFAPTDREMYPYLESTNVAAGLGAFVTISPLAGRLEGADQPSHFNGVATVCMKLFNAVKPTKAYFGEKDFQQTVVIRRLVQEFLIDVEIIVGETVREEDGLALSSRNVYLGSRRRKVASVLWTALCAAAKMYNEGETRKERILAGSLAEARRVQSMQEQMNECDRARFEVVYFELSDLVTMEAVEEVDPKKGALLSGAIRMRPLEGAMQAENPGWRGGTDWIRLIDSIVLEPTEGR